MSSSDTTVEVMAVDPTARGYRIVCRFSKPYGDPVAPGGLYSDPRSGEEAFAVHRVLSRSGSEVTFESFLPSTAGPPRVGSSWFYRGWWVKAAMDAVLDTTATWEHREYPNDGTHEHCLFTWETIAPYAVERSGYWSSAHGWVTEKAYTDFILNDVYHLRE
jgi:hypothetical protein